MEQNFKIAVPEGCTVNIEKKDNFVIVSLEPNNWEPKNGDVIAFGNNPDSLSIGIFKIDNYDTFASYATICGCILSFYEMGWIKKNIRPATEEEKQRLFDALAKEGKRWNPKKKQIEDLPRWRAKRRRLYYFIAMDSIAIHAEETFNEVDNHRYNFGNYFKTKEAAEKVAKQIREIFKNSKAE